MKRFGVLLACMFASCCEGADGHRTILEGDWSSPVTVHDQTLRARLIILEGRSPAYAGPSSEVLVYLELQNMTAGAREPLRIYFDASRNLKVTVRDSKGRPVPPAPGGGSGQRLEPTWVTLPYDSTIRLRANPGGWSTPPDAVLALPVRPMDGDTWLFREKEAGEYALSGTLTVAPPSPDDLPHAAEWRGTLAFPETKLVVKLAGR